MEREVWDVTVTQTAILRICFEEAVSREEAKKAAVSGEYYDIIDIRDEVIQKALDAE